MIARHIKKHRSTSDTVTLSNPQPSLCEDFAPSYCTQNLQIAFVICDFAILKECYG
ncbi:MAG: hypothetical protein UT54_C0017G0004 [Candidatus Daviesbacteria bacterium GW2011_GWB1_39_5]|nr:MAG: hypothetical protein UT54_C0017G0004 [Candidatus Daviesbacteria bacterium GW2011_GWB1_39_5]